MVYIVLLLYILTCVWYIDVRGHVKYRSLLLCILCICFILLSGLRYKIGTDTYMYLLSWEVYPTLWVQDFWSQINKISLFYPEMDRHGIGWIAFAIITKSISNNFNFLLLSVAIIFNIAIFRTIIKYSKYPFLTILIFFLNFKFLEFEFEILRECLAVAVFLLFAFDSFVKKKWFHYYVGCLFTILFHYSALFMLFLPIVRSVNYSYLKYSLLFFLSSLIVGLFGRFFVGDLINIYLGGSGYIGEYMSHAFGKDYNLNYIIQYAYQPIILYLFIGIKWNCFKDGKFTSLLFFSIVFMNLSLIYFTAVRLVSYIIIIDCIAVAPVFMSLIIKYKTIWVGVLFLIIFSLPTVYTFIKEPITAARYFPYQSIIFPNQTENQIKAEYDRYHPSFDN